MRALKHVDVAFGLVRIPMKIYSGIKEDDASVFHHLHEKDRGRVKRVQVCETCGETLASENVVRGYEIAKGRYVVVTDEDIEKIDVQQASTIAIDRCVPKDDVDLEYYRAFYYLLPNVGGERGYALLADALHRSVSVAVVTFVLNGRERLGVIRSKLKKTRAGEQSKQLILYQLRFASEIRPPEEIPILAAKLEGDARGQAHLLVRYLSGPFTPEQYTDTHREALLRRLRARAEGADIIPDAGGEVPAPTPSAKLLEALHASIELVQKTTPPKRRKPIVTTSSAQRQRRKPGVA